MTQKTTAREKNQENVENALANLGTSRMVLKMVKLRISQAMRSNGLSGLLGPALDDVDEVDQRVTKAQAEFSEIWYRGQEKGWWE